MTRKLPIFEGWTIDTRLGEFRKVNRQRTSMKTVRFDSEQGLLILDRINKTKRGKKWDRILHEAFGGRSKFDVERQEFRRGTVR
jgi:hypothetical protein